MLRIQLSHKIVIGCGFGVQKRKLLTIRGFQRLYTGVKIIDGRG